jgi:hypothetical protein
MLRRVIATGVTGLGISAVAMVSPAMPGENDALLRLQEQITNLTGMINRLAARDDERFQQIEDEIRQRRPGSDHTASVRPNPIIVRPTINVRPIVTVQPPRHRHYYPRYIWCPPEWWGWEPPY